MRKSQKSHKLKKLNNFRAFTLVELIAVMAIVATLIGGSIAVIVGLRESSRLRSNVNNFVSEAKTKLSYARNSVYTQSELRLISLNPNCSSIVSNEFAPDALGYFFDPTAKKVKPIKCVSTQLSTSSNFCCVLVTDFDNQSISSNNIEYSADCSGVLFEYATGKVLRFNPEGQNSIILNQGSSTSVDAVSQNCTLEIKHTGINYSQTVFFDSENASIEIK